MIDRKPVFDEVRLLLGRGFALSEVERLDAALDRALGFMPAAADSASPHRLGSAGLALIRQWEGCARRRPDGRYEAYPDPGSRDGKPWTIGYGATGSGIGPATIWTLAQCEERLRRDLERHVAEVNAAIGKAPTAQHEFDALVSFHYNTGAIAKATLTRQHIAGNREGVAREFTRWIRNDGQILPGLQNRRAAEARLYAGD